MPLSLAEKRSLLDWVIRPQLRTLPGVADVNALGGQVRSFEVVPNLLALKARGLTLADLRRALEANNRNDGAGRLAFSGANTYSGPTTINAGTLLVTNTTGSGTGSGGVKPNCSAATRCSVQLSCRLMPRSAAACSM